MYEYWQPFIRTLGTMAASPIADISLESVQNASRAQKVPRGLTRVLMPMAYVESVEADSFGGTAFIAGEMLVIVDTGRSGPMDKQTFAGVIEAAQKKVAASSIDDTSPVVEDGGTNDGANDADAGEENDATNSTAVDEDVVVAGESATSANKISKPLDLIVWTKTPAEGEGTVSVTLTDDEIYVQIADSETNAEKVCELATAMFKAVRMPFQGSDGGRLTWKESQRPRVTREYVEETGDFKLSFEKRFDAIFNNAHGRIQTTFDNVFDAKIISAARGVAGRYARKNKLDVTWKKPKTEETNQHE